MFEMVNGEAIRANGAGIAASLDGFGDEVSVEGRGVSVEWMSAVKMMFDDTGIGV